ncbi:DMT family transporter [Mesorhizobium amorphae]|uniref:DMT family transporter n=1 Tax=Mesorhizobium amorphae TaxID=71433 RepID=UPI001C92B4E7|nr:DMT family transporter [Mesorhizobium amorphae]
MRETKPPHIAQSPLVQRLYSSPYLLLIIATLSWGGNAVASRMAVGQISPMILAGGRWTLVFSVMLVTCRRQIADSLVALKRQWRVVLTMGAAGFTAFSALSYVAAHYTTAVNLSIIQGAIPVFVLLGGFAIHKTPIRAGQLIGVALALGGAALVASNGRLESLARLNFRPGDLIMLGACVFYAGYTLALRTYGARVGVGAIGLFFGLAVAGFATSLPLIAAEGMIGGLNMPTAKGWMILVYVGLIASFMAHVCFIRAVALIGPTRAGLFINLIPAFGALLAVVLIGEPFGLYQAAALILILGGIAIAEVSNGKL